MIHHGENEADRLVPSSLLLVRMSTFSHPLSELTNPRTRFIHVNTTSGPYSFSTEAFKQHAKNRSH